MSTALITLQRENHIIMTTQKNYFAVDLGATSGRTILATFDGKKVQMKEVQRLFLKF